MKAVVAHGANDLRVDEISIPEPATGEVLIAMEWGGICGSDISYWKNGASGTAILREPLILGHEVAGRVAKLGADVTGVEEGVAVTIHPATLVGNHTMPESTAGRTNLWPEVRYFGSGAFLPHEQGGFSEFRTARVDQLRLLPDNLTTKEGAVAEPLGVALHAVNRAGDVAGRTVLVNGAGPIGALTVAALKFRGAGQIFVSDFSEGALRVAKELGADELVNLSAGEGLPQDVEIAFEASGASAAIGSVLAATQRGGTVVQVGNLPGSEITALLGNIVTREINYLGSYRFDDEITDAVHMMAEGFDISPVMTHEFSIDDALEAFETAADRSTGSSKVMLKLS